MLAGTASICMKALEYDLLGSVTITPVLIMWRKRMKKELIIHHRLKPDFDLWYEKTWEDGSNWIGAESALVEAAYYAGAHIADAETIAVLSTVLPQLEAGDTVGAIKMLLAYLNAHGYNKENGTIE